MCNPQGKCCLHNTSSFWAYAKPAPVYTHSSFSLFVSACGGCVERMQKQMHVLGAWRRALHASLSLTRMQQFLWGQVRVEVAVTGKQLLSIAGFLTDGRHFLGRQCCFLLLLGWKAFVLKSILGSQRCFPPSAWNLHGNPKVPQLLRSLPLPFAGTDTDNVSKVGFFFLFLLYVPMKPRLASVQIRRAF